MLEELELFRLNFLKHEPLVIAAGSMIEALTLFRKLPDYQEGEILSISSMYKKVFV